MDTQKKTNRNIKKELSVEQQNRCAVCGREFPVDELQCDHIIPLRLGGSTQKDNIRLVCRQCNAINRDRSFTESQFEQFIFDNLKRNENFRNVSIGWEISGRYRPDIVAERKNGTEWEKIFVEAISVPSLSVARINSVTERMTAMQKMVGGIPVLAITGRLAESFRTIFESKQIEVWDEDYISTSISVKSDKKNHIPEREIINPLPMRTKEEDLIHRLKSCKAGKQEWGVYQKLIGEILECLFCPVLFKPIAQKGDSSGFNRRDFILPNYCESGFWSFMRNMYHADFIVADAKNYSEDIMKEDVLQVLNYLKVHGAGLFGLIICRKGASQNAEFKIREAWTVERKLILVLDDNDIEQMLIEKGSGRSPELVLRQKIEDFRLTM